MDANRWANQEDRTSCLAPWSSRLPARALALNPFITQMQKARRFKRPRALQACEECRARKNRCSEDRPCTFCVGQ